MAVIEMELRNAQMLWSAFGGRLMVCASIVLGLFLAKLITDLANFPSGATPFIF